MANRPSLARRNRAYQLETEEEWNRITEDGEITPTEMREFGQRITGMKGFAIVLDTSQVLTQAADRSTDNERLEEVWETHMMALNHLPLTA